MTKEAPPRFSAKAFLAKVGDGRTIGSYAADQGVFSQGDPADSVFYIQDGKVKLTVVSELGKEAVVAILTRGAFLGEGCLAGQVTRMASAVAMVPSAVVRIEKSAILDVIRGEPAFAELFIAHLLDRAIRVEADLVDQLFNSSEKRLARLLIMLAQVGQEAELRTVATPISQEVMAARVGTTRSRINYFMNKFRKLGLIEYNGHIKVHSSLLNVVIRE
jgi:CRP-like cAMP-binding protein